MGIALLDNGDWSIFRLGDVFLRKPLAENMDLSPFVAHRGR